MVVGEMPQDHPSRHGRPLLRSLFFILTLLVAFAAWVISLTGQIMVSIQISQTVIPSAAAASSSSSPSSGSILPPGVILPPGYTLLALPTFFPVTSTPATLWFALILQPIVVFELVSALYSNTLRAHAPLITTFASIVIVLAAIGVDDNLYASAVSQKLTAAGWMITAIIDSIWVLCLLAAEGTRMRRVFDFLIGQGGLSGPPTSLGATTNVFQNRFTSVLGRVSGTRLRRSHRKEPSDIPIAASVPGSVPGSPTLEKNHDNFVVTSTSPPPTPPVDTVRLSRPQRPSSILSGRVLSIIGGGTPASSVSQLVGSSGLKALALYPYTGQPDDPNELSFKKGEVIEILDKSGKWWEARKGDGTEGLVPSNYMKIM